MKNISQYESNKTGKAALEDEVCHSSTETLDFVPKMKNTRFLFKSAYASKKKIKMNKRTRYVFQAVKISKLKKKGLHLLYSYFCVKRNMYHILVAIFYNYPL